MTERIAAYFGVPVPNGPYVPIPRTRKEFPGLLAALGYQRGAEVGVWEGWFSDLICKAVPGVHLTCVDSWRAYGEYRDKKNDQVRLDHAFKTATDRLTPYGCDILRMSSVEAAKRIPDGSLDFVYLDGNHARKYVDEDLAAWAPKVRKGGLVSGHDYTDRSDKIDVKPAVDAFIDRHGICPLFVMAGDKYPSFFWEVQ